MAYGPVALAWALVATTLVPVLVVLGHGDSGGLAPGDWAAVRFTLWQAALSAVLSVILAIPVGRALFRRRFPGRDGLVVLMGAPFLMPTLVAAMGVIAVFGAGGPLAWLAATMGLPPPDPFGAHGVVLAHVFLNLPLAVRMILHGWHDIPADRMRLAASLGFRPRDILRHLELPMLRAIVPGALAMIFALCLTSFAVALTLGGGPGATTVELGIYQALRFEFDLPRAAQLALVQLGLGAVAAMVAALFWRPALMGTGTGRAFRPIAGDQRGIFIDGMVLAAATAFVAGPLVAVALHGAAGLGELPAAVWPALGRSLAIAVPVAIVTTVLALVLALAAARGGAAGRPGDRSVPDPAPGLSAQRGCTAGDARGQRPFGAALCVPAAVAVGQDCAGVVRTADRGVRPARMGAVAAGLAAGDGPPPWLQRRGGRGAGHGRSRGHRVVRGGGAGDPAAGNPAADGQLSHGRRCRRIAGSGCCGLRCLLGL
jgi:thiamine transport system permease protein